MISSFFCIFLLLFAVFSPCLTKNDSKEERRFAYKKFKDGERSVFVFDNLFKPETIKAYFGIASHGNIEGMVSPWQYSYEDYYFKVQVANSTSHIPWISPIELNFFETTSVWKRIKEVTEKLSGGKIYYPKDAFISMVRRLDFTTVDTGSFSLILLLALGGISQSGDRKQLSKRK